MTERTDGSRQLAQQINDEITSDDAIAAAVRNWHDFAGMSDDERMWVVLAFAAGTAIEKVLGPAPKWGEP